MKLQLSNGGYALIDKEDSELVVGYTWSKQTLGYIQAYVIGSASGGGKAKMIYLHRLLTDFPKEMVVDHINHDRSDNRRKNLRIVTHQQNLWNRKSSNGVYWDKSVEIWKAKLKVDGKEHYLGASKDKQKAIAFRRAGEKKHFGDFANIKYNKTI